ncbi:MAG: nuclear transport factor 2 family protein [Halieaceae bacterium]
MKIICSKIAALSASVVVVVVMMLQASFASAASAQDSSLAAAEWVARQEIALLQRRYAQATDMIAFDREANEAKVAAIYGQIFTEDAPMGVLDRMTLDSPTEWLKMVVARFEPMIGAQHLIGSQVVELESLPDQQGRGGAATMRSYLQATHVNADGTLERVLGIYISDAIYIPDHGWRLSRMTLQLVSTEDAKIAAPLALEEPE